ncbi:auxin-induced protein PCNT115-like [Hibiscus syriacus]|uniref:auxin-induced protein PCNT115-like n=1 Tax=Hibiscus syriacus TaxID=106335 RepID=UPI0019216C95|nr:auxin-induced protein PCNT115-like [Hibiscus syriacus]
MGMSAFYGPPKPEPNMIVLILHASPWCDLKSGAILLFSPNLEGGPAYVRADCEDSLKRLDVEWITAFEMEYMHWIEEQSRQIFDLRTALQAHISDIELRILVESGLNLYCYLSRMRRGEDMARATKKLVEVEACLIRVEMESQFTATPRTRVVFVPCRQLCSCKSCATLFVHT